MRMAKKRKSTGSQPWDDRSAPAVADNFVADGPPPRTAVDGERLSLNWNDVHETEIQSRLWPQSRLMTPITRGLATLRQRRQKQVRIVVQQMMAYRLPASAAGRSDFLSNARIIHRYFRHLLAEDLSIIFERRQGEPIRARHVIEHQPVAAQLRALARAARSEDPIAWEIAWWALTQPAVRMIDAAIELARWRRSKPLKLHPNFWVPGALVSTTILAPSVLLEVWPELENLQCRPGRPSRLANDLTLRGLLALFELVTGRRGDSMRRGDCNHVVGESVAYVRWLERAFRHRLMTRRSASTIRRIKRRQR